MAEQESNHAAANTAKTTEPPTPAERSVDAEYPRHQGSEAARFESAPERSLPYAQVKRVVIISVIVGLLSGLLGSYGFVHYLASGGNLPVVKQQLQVQESSAVIDVAKKVSPSVVSITSKAVTAGYFGSPVEQDAAGTGIIVSSDGLIMTNKHVVADDTATYTVIGSDGKELPGARVVARDSINDIAFVRVNATNLPSVTLGDSGSVQVGQQVVAIGNALGQFQNTVTSGIISGIGRPVMAGDSSGASSAAESLSNLFQTDAAINPGNSGGPLVNLAGQVIGMNTAVAGQGAQNIGFAIPINDAKPLITSVAGSGKIVRPYLGVRYVPLTKDVATANNLKASTGAWLRADDQNPAIVSGSPADKAGLKSGDIITKVAGTAITDANSLQSLIGQHKVGETIELTILRDGKTQTIKVTLAQAPAAS
ncbi:MAG TPA: trypsin-like peptidase domain-containing protein [Candidatus Saccharimonadia bacterium]|nr:trypsin-like peptidase domain-containing protein [Candidatus Saccharimonadia bacterium]